jgi:ParB-like nuclease domain
LSQMLELSLIRVDGGTQPRAAMDEGSVREYAEDMARGAAFPPVVVFYDGTDYWLADGFHRYHAAKSSGRSEVAAEVRQGTLRDAVLFSVGANATHGLRRTNLDKRRAVRTLLADPEWAGWSDREIARRCGVTPTFVGSLRAKGDTVHAGQYRTYVHPKTGHATLMDTAAIGVRVRAPDPDPAVEWAAKITTARRLILINLLETCRRLAAARKSLSHQDYVEVLRRWEMNQEFAHKMLAIAEDRRIADASEEDYLPCEVETLYQLTRLTYEEWDHAVNSGYITWDMEAVDVRSLSYGLKRPSSGFDRRFLRRNKPADESEAGIALAAGDCPA